MPVRTPCFTPVRCRVLSAATLLTAAAFSGPNRAHATDTGSLTPVTYGFTGKSATGDSSITALFQFDALAMSDHLVFFYEIPKHSFVITGSDASLNGSYDRFLGGGISFHDIAPGQQNLPGFQSLVIENSATHYHVQSDGLGNPGVFLGGKDNDLVFTGQWSFVSVPEPGPVTLLMTVIVAAGLLNWRRLIVRSGFAAPSR